MTRNSATLCLLITVGAMFLENLAITRAEDGLAGRIDFQVVGHKAFLLEPAEAAHRELATPWVWYAPTLDGKYPGGAESWMFRRFRKAGIAIAGVDVGESFGNPNGRAAYQAFFREMTQRGYGPKPVLLARSRGGLMLYNWAAEHPDCVGGIAGIYPVCNLTSYPGLERAAAAYGMSADSLRACLSDHNPVDRLEPLAKAQVPLFHLHGDQDQVVPLKSNSAILAHRYRELGGRVELQVIQGQGHNMWRGWFESQTLTDFVVTCAHGKPPHARPHPQSSKMDGPQRPARVFTAAKTLFERTTFECNLFMCTPDDTNSVPSTLPAKLDTLQGKVMVGYQGWFNCEGDGAQLGWKHWARNRRSPFGPGNVTVDLWPDVSELDPDERFATGFSLADGRPAEVFSSAKRKTVLRHFQWMREYGIDGAFLQRFAVTLASPTSRRNNNLVLSHAREGARQSGRLYAVMYDLSGLRAGQVDRVREDWITLRDEHHVADDSAYLHHNGRPLVAVWGIGFSDGRDYSLPECAKLVQWLKTTGCSVMVGVPSFWRNGERDAVNNPILHQIIGMADIVSPWTVGRYRTPDEATRHAKTVWQPDLQWCQSKEVAFLPVVFPGFSWHNLHGGKLDQIPRRKGEFFWSQVVAAKRQGCDMIYVAMFDEVDEGTAIFKCSNSPPIGPNAQFISYEGLPSDHYLKLAGKAGQLLRDEIEVDAVAP